MDKIQILTGKYKVFCDNEKPSPFYQFALNIESVNKDFLQTDNLIIQDEK